MTTTKAAPKAVEHLTLDERVEAGKAARAAVPRGEHAGWTAPGDRTDPVEILIAQDQTRVTELVPIRHGRMLVSPFTFFRGAAAIMAADLATLPRTSLRVQLCGDAHLANFGAYAAPDRRMVFDTNDFDETLPGPFEWDLKRLAASFAVAGRDRGFDASTRASILTAVGGSYQTSMAEFAEMRTFDLWYSRVDVDEFAARWSPRADPRAVKRFERNVAKARAKNSLAALAKLTRTVDGEPRFVNKPPLVVPMSELAPELSDQLTERARRLLRKYRRTLPEDRRHLLERFRFVDVARKVVGVGSVGTRAWIVLLMGRDDDDPLVLQIKEAQTSVLEPYLGKSKFSNHGQRVVEGQRLMQAASDTMLGWLQAEGIDGVDRDFYVRQLWDAKGSAIIEAMEPTTMEIYARLCGYTLARAHARSGDAVTLASYLGRSQRFKRALASFAEDYADQNERDYKAVKAAARDGRIEVEAGL